MSQSQHPHQSRLLLEAVLEREELASLKRVESDFVALQEKEEEQDAEILAAIASRRKLASDLELAKGVQYTEPMKTSCVTETPIDLGRH